MVSGDSLGVRREASGELVTHHPSPITHHRGQARRGRPHHSSSVVSSAAVPGPVARAGAGRYTVCNTLFYVEPPC